MFNRRLEAEKARFRNLADHISGRINDPAESDMALGLAVIGGGLLFCAVTIGPEIWHVASSLFK